MEKVNGEERKKGDSLAAILNCCLYFKCVLFKKKIPLFPKSHSLEKSTKIGVCERGSRLWNIPFSRVKLLY
jgi:hypothetical protein